MSKNKSIVIYHSPMDNAQSGQHKGWVSVLSDFISLYISQRVNQKPEIVFNEFSNQVEADLNLIVLSENTSINPNFKLNAGKTFVIKTSDKVSNENLIQYPTYEFFEVDVQTEESYMFSIDASGELKSLYWMKLLDISYDINNLLYPESKVDTDKNKTVYLAETNNDQFRNRDIIKRELIRHRFNVVPTTPLPKDKGELTKIVSEYLKTSSLSIHIIGNHDATLNDQREDSKVEIQNSVASKHAEQLYENGGTSSDFSRFIWISPDIKFNTERQQAKVDQLKRDVEALQGAEVVQTPMEVFKTIVLNKIGTADSKNLLVDNKIDEKAIYVIYDNFEKENSKKLIDFIKSKNHTVVEPSFEGSQLDIINHHRNCLVNCEAVLVIYNNNNPKWALSKINDMRKSPGFGRIKQFKAKAIYAINGAPHLEKSKKNVEIINGKESFSEKDLFPFLEKLN